MKYHQPFDQPSNPNAAYVDANPGSGIAGSIVPAASIEYPQREIVNLIAACGLTASDSDLKQLAEAVQSGALNYGVAAGTANALAVTLPVPPISYTAGMRVWVKISANNTLAVTIALNALPAVPIVDDLSGAALQRNDLVAGATIEIEYDPAIASFRLIAGSAQVALRTVLFPYGTLQSISYSTSFTPPSGVITGVGGYVSSNGDQNIVTAMNASNSLLTVPNGYDGLWLIQGYANTLTSSTTGQAPANGMGFRLYKGPIASGFVVSAANSPAATIVHGTVVAFMNLNAGDQAQFAVLANDTGDNLTTVTYTAVRLGRSN